ncbi:MAG: ArnT family glycosyltransferase [Anaerolineales bacterium]
METKQVEPSVLDWFLSLLRLRPIPIPEPGTKLKVAVARPVAKAKASSERSAIRVEAAHLRVPAALLLAFIAQIGLGSHSNVPIFVGFYLAAAVLVGWAVWAGDFGQVVMPSKRRKSAETAYDRGWLIAGLGLAILTFITSADNTFRLSTVMLWVASVLLTGRAFWLGDLPGAHLPARFRKFLATPQLRIKLSGWSLLTLALFGLTVYFRISHLDEIPYAMWSDHAEKYLDIVEVLNGETSIFFPRNTGREPAQFYLTAAAIKWFGADFSFLTLKLISTLAGLIAVPYMYLLGREIGGREVGLFAMALAGIAFWPNFIARIGLRHIFHITFAAMALYYTVRGYKARKQSSFVLAGAFLGLSAYGYTASRILPLVLVLGLVLYLAHRASRGHRPQSMAWFGISAAMAIVVAIPLLRVASDMPEDVLYRSLSRIADTERALPGPALQLFLSNMWNALRMFSWDAGQVWIVTLPSRPILAWVTGALFHLGLVLLVVRYVKGRNWLDIFLVLSIPILLLPSVLSLAFPIENPHPSRASGAFVPVFTITGIALASVWSWSQRRLEIPWSKRIGIGLVGGLFMIAAVTNYDLVIGEFGDMHRQSSWNTAQAAEVVESFTLTTGSFDDVHMVAYPHWMDSRLVAVLAGRPGLDIVLWPEQIEALPEVNVPQLFMLHHADEEGLDQVRDRFPDGIINRHAAEVEGRDFITYLVPGEES